MGKNKICWVTSSYLLDVDIPIVPHLQSKYDIDWIVLTTQTNYDGDKALIESNGCKQYRMIETNGIFIHPKKYIFYRKLLGELKGGTYDLYYFDFMGMPYFLPMAQCMLPKEKIIIAAHNVKTPKGARYYWMAKPYMDYTIKAFKNFQVFSLNQLELLRSLKKDANILYAPLCLKDYGNPIVKKPEAPITFLFFGNIVDYKRVDLLLQATRIMNDKGIKGFKVQISGYCRPEIWKEKYEPMLKGLDNVATDIRRIPNEDIPNLFENSHYFVMPYQDIAQSGAMTVALRYNVPIIASELDTFKEFMDGKEDGYFFESGSPERLAEAMTKAIQEHGIRYQSMRENQANKVKEKLSHVAIIARYKEYIDALCQN
jgi:glycosyltransferase involved in cell wall biosynthesis